MINELKIREQIDSKLINVSCALTPKGYYDYRKCNFPTLSPPFGGFFGGMGRIFVFYNHGIPSGLKNEGC